jgi:hypothetical protein
MSEIAGNWVAETYRLNLQVQNGASVIPIDTSVTIPDGKIYMNLHEDHTYRDRMTLDDFLDIIGIIMDKVQGQTVSSGMNRKTLANPVDTGTWSLSGNVLSTYSIVGNSTRPLPVTVHGDTLVGTGTIDLTMQPISAHGPFTITFTRR